MCRYSPVIQQARRKSEIVSWHGQAATDYTVTLMKRLVYVYLSVLLEVKVELIHTLALSIWNGPYSCFTTASSQCGCSYPWPLTSAFFTCNTIMRRVGNQKRIIATKQAMGLCIHHIHWWRNSTFL